RLHRACCCAAEIRGGGRQCAGAERARLSPAGLRAGGGRRGGKNVGERGRKEGGRRDVIQIDVTAGKREAQPPAQCRRFRFGRGEIRSGIAGLALALAAAAHAAEVSPLGLAYVETPDLRLIHFEPALGYLVPHAVGTFTNALAWERRVLGWEPYE